jgi:hypothetical protein
MRNVLLPAVAMFALVGTTACTKAASEPAGVDTEALVESASAWTPSDITRDLAVDGATRQRIEDALTSLHTSLKEMHERHQAVHGMEGEARAAQVAELEAEMQRLHEQHKALWDSLDPDVQKALAARLHERMADHHGEEAGTLHERLRRLHHGDAN